MKKKLVSAMLTVMLTAFTIAGCGAESNSDIDGKADEAVAESEAEKTVEEETKEETVCDKEGHDFSFATVDAPKTCKICGATEGEAVKLNVLSEVEVGIDDYFMSNGKYYFTDKWINEDVDPEFIISVYNLDGTLINELSYKTDSESDYYGVWVRYLSDDEFYMIMLGIEGVTPKSGYGVVDLNGNVLWSHDEIEDCYVYSATLNDGKLYAFLTNETNGETVLIDTETNQEVTYEEVFGKYDSNGVEIVNELYEKWEYVADSVYNDLYFLSNEECCGFADKDGNILATYIDCSEIGENNYFFARNDEEVFSIYDSEFNLIVKDVIEGQGAAWCGGHIYVVRTYEGDVAHYSIVSLE